MSKIKQSLVQTRITYKNIYRIVGNVLAIVCGSLYFGYVLAYFSIIPFAQLAKQFHIYFEYSVAKGIFSGLIPIGGGVGALSSAIISKKFSRRNSLLFVCGISLIGDLLVQIPSFLSLLIGRLIQGICVGLYSSICPLFIKQISPIELSGFLGTFNIIFIVLGVNFTYIIALFIPNNPQTNITPYWRLIFAVPVAIVAIQAILLLFVYKNQTLKYLLLEGRQNQAHQLIAQLYKEQYIDEILKQKQNDINQGKSLVKDQINKSQKINQEKQIQIKFIKLTTIVAIHVGLLQQMCGINIIVLYGTQIFNNAIPGKGALMQVFLQSSKLIACLLISHVITMLGRKTLLQIGTLVSTIVLIGLGITYLPSFTVNDQLNQIQQIIIIISLFTFVVSYGFTLGPVVWLYIPEIVQPKIIPYSTLSNWAGASLTIILFPIIGEYIGNYSLFFFLGLWCMVSIFFNHVYLVETKDKTQIQITQQYEKFLL